MKFEEQFVRLQEQLGHHHAPLGAGRRQKLASWVSWFHQHQQALTSEQVGRLDAIGFSWNTREDSWERRYAQLAKFKQQQGHCFVSRSNENAPGLGDWLNMQRQTRRTLPAERRERLEQLGVAWEAREMRWKRRYEELRAFHGKYGHSRVPVVWPENPQLGLWVAAQRQNSRGKLTPERRARLDALGFEWNPPKGRKFMREEKQAVHEDRLWESLLGRLKQFRQEHGHSRVPKGWARDRELADWVLRQRTLQNQLTQEQVEKLLPLGFQFGRREGSWYRRFFDLRDYINRHGRFPKSTDREVDGDRLYDWVLNQRIRREKETLNFQQIQWMNVLGMQWEKHGHCLVPVHFPENFPFGHWITKIRSRKCRLNEEQIRQLDELGFDWNPLETSWENRYRQLVTYVKEHGHFPWHSTGDHQLTDWVSTQRDFRDSLSPERKQKLDAIGFPWDPLQERWERRYRELVAFRKQFGHCRVPADESEWQPLYKWLHFQKSQRARLRLGRRKRLDALGIDWSIQQFPSTEERMEQLEAFFAKHGHCNVIQADDQVLAMWLSNVRSRKENLSTEMRNRLEAMGIDWSPLQTAAEKRLEELAAFREKHGHCRVPIDWPENPGLGQWIQTQKVQYSRGRLSAERKQRLDQLGFEWGDWEEARWEESYRKLVAFREAFGHCRVPHSRDKGLAAWVYRQRAYRNQLSPKQVQRLNDIGFAWKAKEHTPVVRKKDRAPWEQRFNELGEFHASHGHCTVPLTYEANPSLAQWVAYQRENWSELFAEQLLSLIRLDFVFNTSDEVWIRRFGELAEAVRGGMSVADLCQANHSLWCWVGYQRSIRRKLSAGQVRLLEEMGVEWDPREAAWMRQYEKLVEFHRVYGHFQVPKAQDPGLASWTSIQRQGRKGLSVEKRRLLEKIGFPWDPQTDEMEERFEQLKAFKRKYGHCMVPMRTLEKEFPKLGRWVESLRARRSKLPAERVARLNAMGFVWSVEEAKWEQCFQELAAFCRRFGHCQVPRKWPENPGFGRWVALQRKYYHRLSADQQRRLRELGFSRESRIGRPPAALRVAA